MYALVRRWVGNPWSSRPLARFSNWVSKSEKGSTMRKRRLFGALVLVSMVATLAGGSFPSAPVAEANGQSSISLNEPFTGASLNDPSNWISIRGGGLLEWPCLTAATVSSSVSVGSVEACVSQAPSVSAVAVGDGAMRLTRRQQIPGQGATGTLLYTAALSAAEGIDISFSIRMDDGQVADGMSFFLKDGTNTTNTSGTAGGALGYGRITDVAGSKGVPGALFGIGFDKYGSFSTPVIASDCGSGSRGPLTNHPGLPGTPDDQIVLRGPDNSAQQDGSSGYCYLAGTNVTISPTDFQRVRVVVPPYTPNTPTTVSVYLAPSTNPTVLPQTSTLTGTVTISATTFKFGFSASSGYWSNDHDLRGLVIRPAGPTITTIATTASTGSGTGPTSGGTELTITGSGIDPSATVTVDGQPCTGVTVSAGGTELTCTTPAGSLGTKQVVITNPNGGPGYGTFTYVNPTPTVTAVTPSSGAPAGGNTVTITGTGFVTGATATLGGQPCTNVNVVSSTSLTCVVPAGTEGAVVDATVTNLGPVSGTGNGLYTYRTPSAPVFVPAPTTTIPPSTTTTVPAPVPAPNGVLPSLPSAETLVTEDGRRVEVELIVENDEALVLRNQDFELRLRGACTTGCTITENSTGRETIHLDRSGGARVSGFGFLPGSLVHVWIFSEPRYLGSLLVAADGTYDGTFPLRDIEVGQHTLQANGFSFDNVARSANLGIVVVDPVGIQLPVTGSSMIAVMVWASLFLAAAMTILSVRRQRFRNS